MALTNPTPPMPGVTLGTARALDEDHTASRGAEHSPAAPGRLEAQHSAGKWTPGPWQSKHDYTRDGQLTIIGNVDGPDDGVFHYTTICEVDDGSAEADEAFANARLIASAPALHAALRSLVDAMVADLPQTRGYATVKAAYAALAAADGQA